MKVIGITGGVGAGKSTVLRYIESISKSRIIYADNVAGDMRRKGQPCYEKLVDLLSDSVLSDDGEIDSRRMAQLIFADPSLLQKVNDIVHPMVNEYIQGEVRLERQKDELDYLFIEAALLIENGYEDLVDELWYVYADEESRRKRLKASRGYTDEKISDILDRQLKDEDFRRHCDRIIDNSGDEETMHRTVDSMLGVD